MNSVSWFIYFAEVAGGLKNFLEILGFILLFLCGGYTIVSSIAEDAFTPAKMRYVVAAVGAIFFSVFLPSKNTIYAIAASQVGEKIVMSQQVQGITDDATKALHQWIKRQIDSDKSEKK